MPKPLFCANGDAIWLRIHAHTVLQAAEKQCPGQAPRSISRRDPAAETFSSCDVESRSGTAISPRIRAPKDLMARHHPCVI
ncbi:hypothetical protein SAMN03159417_02478 [Ralstonia sp. NFACC01]|nr:hypothetical protein SAMN03159417_02478 [Ralstonia sp. NFACC01]